VDAEKSNLVYPFDPAKSQIFPVEMRVEPAVGKTSDIDNRVDSDVL